MRRCVSCRLGVSILLVVLSGVLLVAAPPQRGGQAVQAETERPGPDFNLEEALQQRQQMHDWLWSEVVAEGISSPLRIEVPERERARIDELGENARPVRVGLTRAVRQVVSLADLAGRPLPAVASPRALGAVRATNDGGYAFSAAVNAPGATGVRLHFTRFWLPAGAGLYLLTEDGQVFGPYVGSGPLGDGDFWSHTVMGESVIVQLRQFGQVSAEDLADTWFEIAELGFIGPKFLGARADAQDGFCAYNEPCVVNAECGTNPAVDEAINAVAHMQWIAGAFIYMCSGGLIADTDPGSQTPYFLSANHCISRAKDARNLECFFQYNSDQYPEVQCNSTTCPDLFDVRARHPQDLRTLGASIKSTNRTGDYTLFELAGSAPSGSAFLGWSSTPVANTADALYRISHPSGAPQAYSEHRVDTTATTCSSWPRGSWIYSRDTYGATEGGSSGSPVVNAQGQVVGQLSGACGFNVNEVCDNGSNATVDGAFASYFGQIAQFLDPVPCSPTAEICNDGFDNDCDEDVDCADSDCSVDPSCQTSCGGNGTACSSGADCCSGNCKRGSCKGN